MKLGAALLALLPALGAAFAPSLPPAAMATAAGRGLASPTAPPAAPLRAAASDDLDDDDDDLDPPVSIPKSSLLEGNQRAPTATDLSVMDDMISKLSNAEVYELPGAVRNSFRVCSSPQFFLRIATLTDQATDPTEKARLVALSENLVTTIDAVVSTAEDRLEERAREVEEVVMAASEPGSGEFLVPLSADRIGAMREALAGLDPSSLDEGFLSTVDAWMNKSHQDGMDGMVGILQRVLQMYAGEAIGRSRVALQARVGAAVAGESPARADEAAALAESGTPTAAARLVEELLGTDADLWDGIMRAAFEEAAAEAKGDGKDDDGEDGDDGEKGVSPRALLGEVQRTIEAVVLGLENGSMAQRVQAEFLKEMVTRIETLEKQMAA